ncbi:MAG: OmpA family protein [candidate division KSB1 bacterium]|nr:OmpA family protein [candidate division KSB1 bacterium]MDZ7275020.1 OmpA family protein [candidate division KSB1 bacterium]MDZ7286531.1 OmpA family protein [candidate division KSB1 bacterium]MDZ7299305.1 OmpA family protein [candidate division KSB1 bacterium]MDZ7306976.1 OmpA family protein [candidate division KSB1 bacterium]
MKNPLVPVLIVLLAGLAATTGYFFNRYRLAQLDLARQSERIAELESRVQALANQTAAQTLQWQQEVARITQEKEQEIARLSGTQEALINELKHEIEQKEIQITRLADRLSVRLVDKILFPSGEADLSAAGVQVLQRVGNIIKHAPDQIIRVEGHTDNVPIAARLQARFPTNWELATARATNVVRFLQESVGIAPERLQAVGLSQYHPIDSNDTAAGRSRNRRIEILLLPAPAAASETPSPQ